MDGAISIDEARERSGLRLVLLRGLPSPWSQAAKGLVEIEGVPYVRVQMLDGDTPESLSDWTGQTSYPAAMYEDEAPRSGWAEILLLVERLAERPSLLPKDPATRATLFGYAHEICGEEGFGWSRRLQGIIATLEEGGSGFPKPIAEMLGPKYGYRPGEGDAVRARVIGVLNVLSRRLRAQRDAGSDYYLGDSLTALDIYSATFIGLCKPLPPEQCALPEFLRAGMETMDAETAAALDPILLEHRDNMMRAHFRLPMEF